MRTGPLLALATLAFVAAEATVARADKPGADWITIEQVMQRLRAAGYRDVRKIEADDGHWEGQGVKDGKLMEFHMDPRSGAFTKERPDDD
jgi:hypothetical protein